MAETGFATQRPLFYALVLLAGYLTYLILGPFLAALGWAAILAIMFHRVQTRLAARIGASWAAVVTTVLAGVLIVVPAVLLVSALVHELPQAAAYLQQTSRSARPRSSRSGKLPGPGARSRCRTIRPHSWPRACGECSPFWCRGPAPSSPTSSRRSAPSPRCCSRSSSCCATARP